MQIGFRIKGAKELERALRELPNNIAKNVITRALKEAAQPIADHAQSLAPIDQHAKKHKPGRLKSSIAVSTRLTPRQRSQRVRSKGETTVFIGPSAVKEGITEEFGTGPRHTSKGKFVGQVQAHPFLRPAWDAGKFKALDRYSGILWQKIEAAARKLARRAGKT